MEPIRNSIASNKEEIMRYLSANSKVRLKLKCCSPTEWAANSWRRSNSAAPFRPPIGELNEDRLITRRSKRRPREMNKPKSKQHSSTLPQSLLACHPAGLLALLLFIATTTIIATFTAADYQHLAPAPAGQNSPKLPLTSNQESRLPPIDEQQPTSIPVNNHRRRHHHKRSHHHHWHHRHEPRQASSNDNQPYFSDASSRPVVATSKGLVRGITQKLFTGKYVDSFLSVPYAQPPVGKYRFKHPQAARPWTGELDASRLPNSCHQINDTYFGSNFLGTSIWNAPTPLNEDCLYLNIWTPFGIANLTQASQQQSFYSSSASSGPVQSAKRSVLVWIFGGGFYSGTSALAVYDGGILASEEDIIVVSLNYRVSSLGFLYFGRPDSPGNAGLFDQLMALQWIQDNIEQFGGDRQRVTIFGESAGAVSISFHLLSPLSRQLFQQAILQSGAATCPWGVMDRQELIANGLQLAQLVNCPYNETQLDQVMECLLKVDPSTLVSQDVGAGKTILNFPFVPVVDGSFLIEPPAESLAKADFKQAKLLLGSNYDEGYTWLIYLPEFSHCPGASSSEASSTTAPSIVSTEPIRTLDLNDDPNGSAYQPPIERSLDVLTSGRQQQQHSASIEAKQQNNVSATSIDSELDLSGNNGSNSQSLANSSANNQEPKPCIPKENLSLNREDFLKILRDDFLNPYAKYPIGREAIVFEYSNWINPNDIMSNYDALDKIVGDYYFTCHVNEFAHRYSQAGNSVYMYYFKQHSSISPWPKYMGVLHGDEINFVFGEPLNVLFNYTDKEVELSRRMMKYWANFAKYG